VPAHAVEEVPAPFVGNLARRAASLEGPSVAGVLADRRLLSPAAVVHLQRLAGNSSVSQLLARNERPAEPHRELTLHLVAQRDGDEPAAAAQTESSDAQEGQEINVPAITVDGKPGSDEGEGGCDNLSLHGNTHADFDGGPGSTVTNQKASISKGCDPACGPDVKCINLTGTRVSAYKATVQVNMPDMPSGLTECEQGKVQDFLDKVPPAAREGAREGAREAPQDLRRQDAATGQHHGLWDGRPDLQGREDALGRGRETPGRGTEAEQGHRSLPQDG
jgi:hypothetical protein